ncbi:MAG: GTPase [Actinomycetota bacterium]|jgi:GTP-binding protein Era|nr:GTPase [Actinomycetota bacterium]
MTRAGMVAVVGRPNVGKSTLVNTLVGQKIAIVSDKPQTTRNDIRAVWTTEDMQVVFTDTPGFHKPRTLLGRRLNELVADAVDGVDLVLLVVDAASGVGRGDAFVYARQVQGGGIPAFCVVNKLDATQRPVMLRQLGAAQELGDFAEIVPISARSGDGVDTLRRLITEAMPEGPFLYPVEDVTDQSTEQRITELIREQALRVTREEVPHSVAVTIEEMEREGDLHRIHASIVVERDSQKGIIIGKGGQTLQDIGSSARAEIERLLDTKVYLDIRVKVVKEWQRDPKALNRLGF